MGINKKYNIPEYPSDSEAKQIFLEALRAYKAKEIKVDELSSVADVLATHSYGDSDLSRALEAALELDYYRTIAKDEEIFAKFLRIVDAYWVFVNGT